MGPVTLRAENGPLTVEQGATRTPDATLWLTADQYVRLVAGPLPLDRALDQGLVTAQGERTRVMSLNRIFRGIGGGS